MKSLFMDLETIPTQDQDLMDWLLARNHAKARKADPDKLYRDSGLNGAMGELVCIGWAVDDQAPLVLYRNSLASGTERELLRAFIDEMRISLQRSAAPVWIGHNIKDFDLRFIMQRATVLGVEWPFPVNFKTHVYDTMLEWAGWGKMVSLEEVGMALGVPTKTGEMTGAKVWDAIQEGRYKDVADYCLEDVIGVRQIYHIMTGKMASPRSLLLPETNSSSILRVGSPHPTQEKVQEIYVPEDLNF